MLFYLFTVNSAFACDLKKLPENLEIKSYEAKLQNNVELNPDEKSRLEEFHKDRLEYETFMAALSQCSTQVNAVESVGYSKDEVIKNIDELEKKWEDHALIEMPLESDRVKSVDGFYELDLENGEYNFE